jgi:hypothetical protein
MNIASGDTILGSARVSCVGDRVLAITDFCDALLRRRLLRRDGATSTRDACATQFNFNRGVRGPV